MRKTALPIAIAATMLIAGCTNYGSGGLLGGVLGGSNDRYGSDYGYSYRNNNDFERAAVNACGREATRYGRVSINSVEQEGRDTVVVTGRINSRDRNRDQFGCTFRSNGRIVDFKRF